MFRLDSWPLIAGKGVCMALADEFPQLLEEWDYAANHKLQPNQLKAGSSVKASWICTLDARHKWEATIYARTKGQGCPVCKNLLVLPGVNDLASTHQHLATELDSGADGYIPAQDLVAGTDKRVPWKCIYGHTWVASVKNRVGGQGCPVCSNRKLLPGFNDFAIRFPELVTQLDSLRNEDFDPTMTFPSSRRKVWWVCDLGHSWFGTLFSRTVDGSSCPTCRIDRLSASKKGVKRKFVQGKHDLASTHPELVKEWSEALNLPLTPEQVGLADKSHLVWWHCTAGHDWQATVRSRTLGAGCLVCLNKVVVPGVNDLLSQFPSVAREFDHELNGELTPSTIAATSFRMAWWRCELGHKWESRVYLRSRGYGCPYCANKKVWSGFNDLETLFPDLAAELAIAQNDGKFPSEILANTGKQYWWQCPQGHTWKASPKSRSAGVGCPSCAGRRLEPGFNDLETRFPGLAAEYDSIANSPLLLSEIHSKNHNKLWWKCAEGHAWQASTANRINGAGCPSCATYGFDPNKSGYFYFIENSDLQARKIGIANTGSGRLEAWVRLGWKTLLVLDGSGRDTQALEIAVMAWIRKDLGMPQYLDQSSMSGRNGATETFSSEGVDSKAICDVIAKFQTGLGS
jgi:hypothetical protein